MEHQIGRAKGQHISPRKCIQHQTARAKGQTISPHSHIQRQTARAKGAHHTHKRATNKSTQLRAATDFQSKGPARTHTHAHTHTHTWWHITRTSGWQISPHRRMQHRTDIAKGQHTPTRAHTHTTHAHVAAHHAHTHTHTGDK